MAANPTLNTYSKQDIFVPHPYEYTPSTHTRIISNEFVSSGCLIARVLLGGKRPAKPRLAIGKLYSVANRPGGIKRSCTQYPIDTYGRERRHISDTFHASGVAQYGGRYDTAVVARSRTELRVDQSDPRRMRLDSLVITLEDDIDGVRPNVALHYESTPNKQAAYLRLDGQSMGGDGALANTFNPSRRLADCEAWVPPVLHTMADSIEALATMSVSSLVLSPEQPAQQTEHQDPYAETDNMLERALIIAHRILPNPYSGS